MSGNLRLRKRAEEQIAALTAYDYPTARLLAECGIDLILVGDSLGMVVLGHPDTTAVTMADMLHHTRAVVRGAAAVPVIADLPFGTYRTAATAVANARLLIEAGAVAVKLEGGTDLEPQLAALAAAGVPVVGHVGMLPQRVREEGGYKTKGKTPEGEAELAADLRCLEAHGARAVVLEMVEPQAAGRLTRAVAMPTIGIGSGPECDGQILVLHDLVGLFPWFRPKFATARADAAAAIRGAVGEFIRAVKEGRG